MVEEAANEAKWVEAAREAAGLIAAQRVAEPELPDNEMAGNLVYSQDTDQDEEDLQVCPCLRPLFPLADTLNMQANAYRHMLVVPR